MRSYTHSAAQWTDKLVVPTKKIGDYYIMEIFHGPTFAFKDVALQVWMCIYVHVRACMHACMHACVCATHTHMHTHTHKHTHTHTGAGQPL